MNKNVAIQQSHAIAWESHYAILCSVESSQVSLNKTKHDASRFFTSENMEVPALRPDSLLAVVVASAHTLTGDYDVRHTEKPLQR